MDIKHSTHEDYKYSTKMKLHFNLFLHVMIKLVGYKYTMRPSEQKFTILILYWIYIFRASLYEILLYFLFLKNIYLSIGESLPLLNETFCSY
jgi:hypothetical protein